MRRQWVADTLMSDARITDPVRVDLSSEPRIYQGESFSKPPQTKPFIVYRLGNTSPDDQVRSARRQYVTIYVHDDANPGDYTRIDEIIDAVIDVFTEAPASPEDHLICARFLETSADFDDREMGTILRYVRFHLILDKWTQ